MAHLIHEIVQFKMKMKMSWNLYKTTKMNQTTKTKTPQTKVLTESLQEVLAKN